MEQCTLAATVETKKDPSNSRRGICRAVPDFRQTCHQPATRMDGDVFPLRFDRRRSNVPVEATGELSMEPKRIDLPQGTLDLLILKTVSLGPQHGWAISERLQQISTGRVHVQQGSLYPALHRLERRGLIRAEWAPSDNNRNAKYYELTARGRRQLETETTAWRDLSRAIEAILGVG